MASHPVRKYKSQQGAALLIFMLILISASSYALVTKLNAATKTHTRQQTTSKALAEAKQALISYAVTYPDKVNPDYGPGYLPCPDINNNGSAGGSCSAGGDTTIGRFPWVTLKMNDLTDSSGQRLWYALTDNYKYNPKLEPLNSETPGQLNVDVDADGDIDANDIDDIVAVLIAPGAPINNQNRDPGETDIAVEIANYLEADNADFDTDFVISNSDAINDRLIFITRQELMEQVEKRVLGEVSQFLLEYKHDPDHDDVNGVDPDCPVATPDCDDVGAYPWLSPFADPKAVARQLRDTAGSASNALNLQDGSTNIDFTDWGVSAGDMVYNLSDGSVGAVTGAVTSNSLTVASLQFGVENDFDEYDEYVVIPQAIPVTLAGTASAGGDNNTLVDNSRVLNDMGIAVGHIINNLTDNSSSVINAISANSIEVDGLTGGTDNLFQLNDVYQIRSNYGVVTTVGSSATQLDDTNKNFVTMGVQAGDIVRNLTDGSIGTIIPPVNATSLTVDQLDFGTNNVFFKLDASTPGDTYVISRFNAASGKREGHLSLHEVGELFPTDFNLDWNINTLNTADIAFIQTPSPGDPGYVETDYQMSRLYLENYALADSESIDDTNGFCVWSVADIADCYGHFRNYLSFDGRQETDLGNLNDRIYDSTATFDTDSIKRGDIVQNYDDEITVISGTADAGSSGGTLVDAANDFSSLVPYSYMIHNNTQGARALLVNIVDADTLETEDYIGALSTAINFNDGDSYSVYAPRNVVVDYIVGENWIRADQYTSYQPDFERYEYFRVIPAANSFSGTVDDEFEFGEGGLGADLLVGQVKLEDDSADFIDEGIAIGDVIYVPERDDYFGEILAVTATTITTTLYGGGSHTKHFHDDDDYTIYHDYVYSRKHEFRSRHSGTQATNTVSQERVRDVCMGYNATCTATTAAVNFSGNGGVPLITIRDYEADGVTEVGRATFTPSAASSGSLRTSSIDYYLHDVSGDLPSWFVRNDWHKLVYVAYSSGDAPGAAAACTVIGGDCLTLNDVQPATPNNAQSETLNNNIRALVISAGMETNKILDSDCVSPVVAMQDRSNGSINEYFESKNCDQSDDLFQEQLKANDFNDQVLVVESL